MDYETLRRRAKRGAEPVKELKEELHGCSGDRHRGSRAEAGG